MSAIDDKKNYKKVFELCIDFYQYELFIKKSVSEENINGVGYLIDNNLINIFLNSIFYKQLKNNLKDGYSKIKDQIQNLFNDKIFYQTHISETKFNKIKDLKDSLNNKEYKLITSTLWKKVCHPKYKDDQGIKYIISNQKISLIFNEQEKLDFKINDFIISKTTLIENIENLNNNKEVKNIENIEIKNNKPNNTNEIIKKDINIINKSEEICKEIQSKLRIEIKILIKIYFLEKDLKQKIDNYSLNNEIKNMFYIIPKKWLDTFKKFFFYESLSEYLNKNKEKKFDDIILHLPEDYKAKINKIKDIPDMEYDYNYSTKIISEKAYKYLKNNAIIDQDIYDLLISLEYLCNKNIKQCEIFKLNEKYLLKLNKEESDFKNLIGIFDENNNFIEEYIFELKESIDIQNEQIKEIIIDFNKVYSHNSYRVINKQNLEIGFCYKINHENIKNEVIIIKEINDDNNLNQNILNNINTNQNKNKNINSKIGEGNNDYTNNNINQINNPFFELNEGTKKDILALIKYYKYKIQLDLKIERSKNDQIIKEEIYLVNLNLINKLKSEYNYRELIGKIDKNKEITYQNLENILSEINMLEAFSNKQIYDNNDLESMKLYGFQPKFKTEEIHNGEIIYPIEFDIINEEIFNDIFFNYENIKMNKCPCIINGGKLIIKFIDGEKNKYLILIGIIDKIRKQFCYEMIFNYNNDKCVNYHFDRFYKEKYELFINKAISEDKTILYTDNSKPGIKQLGTILILDSNKIINKENIKQNNKKSQNIYNNIIPINQEKLKHVQFLLSLYFINERLSYKINEPLSEFPFRQTYYLINKDVIDAYKNCYKYNELLKALNTNEIMELIKKYKNNISFIPEFQVNQLLKDLMKLIDIKYYDSIQDIQIKQKLKDLKIIPEIQFYDNNPELFYYTNCQLINEEMVKLIDNENRILNKTEVLCTFGNNTVFLMFDNIVNFGKFDDNYVFDPHVIVKLKNEKNLASIFKQINDFNYNLFVNTLRFTQIICKKQKVYDYEAYIIQKENIIMNQVTKYNLNKIIGQKNEMQNIQYIEQEQEEDQNSLTNIVLKQKNSADNIFIKERLKILILFYIDFKDLKAKSGQLLNQNYYHNNFGEYYLLNHQWFMKYLDTNNFTNIYHYLMTNCIIENVRDFENLSLERKIDIIMEQIIKFDKKIISFGNNNMNCEELKKTNLFNLKLYYFNPNQDINIQYYQNFFLVRETTYKYIMNYFELNYEVKNYCYVGENLIYIRLINGDKYTLQIGQINKDNYYFSTELFLYFDSENNFKEAINILIQEGNKKFWEHNLIMHNQNDYYSPIFNDRDIIIGDAFRFYKDHSSIDFPRLFINENLKSLILFYMQNEILKKSIKTDDINRFRKYYLISTNWLEEYRKIYEYNNLVKEFKKNNNFIKEVGNLKPNEKLSFTEKKLCHLVKSLPPNFNYDYNIQNYEFINNISIEPYIEVYQFEKYNSLLYFDKFELISEEIYNRLFGRGKLTDINLNKQKNNYVSSIFFESILFVELSKNVTGIEDYVIEVGYLDNNNIFIPYYILMYKDQKTFLDHLKYLNQGLGIKNFFHYSRFDNGCCTPIFDGNNNMIGKMYNLKIAYKDDETEIKHSSINSNRNNIHINNDINNSDLYTQIKINNSVFDNNMNSTIIINNSVNNNNQNNNIQINNNINNNNINNNIINNNMNNKNIQISNNINNNSNNNINNNHINNAHINNKQMNSNNINNNFININNNISNNNILNNNNFININNNIGNNNILNNNNFININNNIGNNNILNNNKSINNNNGLNNNNQLNNNKNLNNQIIKFNPNINQQNFNNFNNNNNKNFGNFSPISPFNIIPNHILNPNPIQIPIQNALLNSNQNRNFDNKNIIINKPQQSLTIYTLFPKPPLMGLKNVGATCYMNATLQCFSQIDKLVNYYKFKPYVEQVIQKYKNLNKLCLTESFKDLIENLWPSNFNYIKKEYVHQNSNNSYFAPYKFKEKISNMNDLFKGVQANDSKDLVNFIIMTLHEEMNKAPQKLKNDFMNINIDQRNKNLILYNFMKNFQDENKSIISDLFYAQNNNMTQCLSCKEIKYNFQTYFFIIFPLEEIRKFMSDNKKNKFIQTYNYLQNMNPMLFQLMLNNFMYNIQNQNYVTIYDCFNYNQKTDFFTGENSMYCNKCQKQNPASYTVKLYTGPQILIIILNRGVGIQYKVKLEFNQTLNLTPYIEKTSTGCFYNLIGVVTHMGESGATGHFIAYCKSPIDKQWYRYNDDLVSQVYNFKQEIIDYAMPYILFFQKIK